MNVPLGTQEIAGRQLSEELVRDLISFMDSTKTGYFCLTTEGEHGVEDALLVMEAGNLIGAHYTYLAFGTEHFAGEALKRIMNSVHATSGVYDSYTLSSQQLELLKIFNENILLLERIPLRAFEGMIPTSFSSDFEKQEISVGTDSREEVFKKRGLSDIKIDDYSEIKSQIESASKPSSAAAKVADEIGNYLQLGKKPEQKEEPVAKPVEQQPVKPEQETGKQELEKLNNQASKLKKLLLKEK